MTKDLKTKIAFTCFLSLFPILVFVKLNYISSETGVSLIIILTVLSFFFGMEYIRDFGDKTKM